MNKAELVKAITDQTEASQAQAGKFVDTFCEAVTETLVKGEELVLIGFGSFKVSNRKARDGRNPKTGAALQVKSLSLFQVKL